MIGRVDHNNISTAPGLIAAGIIAQGRVLDIHDPNNPIRYDFSNYPQFGEGCRVGFDLQPWPNGAVTAINLRVPTESDLALLPYAATGAMAPSPSGT